MKPKNILSYSEFQNTTAAFVKHGLKSRQGIERHCIQDIARNVQYLAWGSASRVDDIVVSRHF